jgi:hypothetical protein
MVSKRKCAEMLWVSQGVIISSGKCKKEGGVSKCVDV